MKSTISTIACCLLIGVGAARALEPKVLTKEPLPSISPLVIEDPVPVPESMVATILAGVGFIMLFRRRRYN